MYCRDLATGKDQRTLIGHRQRAFTIAFSPDSKQIVSAAQEAVLMWDVASGEEKLRLKHGNSLNSSAIFSPESRWIITGGWEGSTRLWDARSGALRAKFSGTGGVDRLAFAPASNALAVISTGTVVAFFQLTFDAPPPQVRSAFRANSLD